ncbi:MAG: hypothetical protein V3W04_06115 [Gammaproteobacteria bacterium]
MSQFARMEIDRVFLSILDEIFSNIIGVSEQAANEILDMSSQISTESAQSAVQSFQVLYQADQRINDIKCSYNREIDGLLEQGRADSDKTASDHPVTSVQQDGEKLAEVQAFLEQKVNRDQQLQAEISPVIVGMQFADTTSQHLSRLSRIWRSVVTAGSANGDIDRDSLLSEIQQILQAQVELRAFYKELAKTDPPDCIEEENLADWIDDLFEGTV